MESNALHILVFDYAVEDCAYTVKMVREYFASRDAPAEVREFSENDLCVYDFEGRQEAGIPYHMAFMGADAMRDIEVARHIRAMDQQIPLFLVSEVSDMALVRQMMKTKYWRPLAPQEPVSAAVVGRRVVTSQ